MVRLAPLILSHGGARLRQILVELLILEAWLVERVTRQERCTLEAGRKMDEWTLVCSQGCGKSGVMSCMRCDGGESV